MLEAQDWQVDVCMDGLTALGKIQSNNKYDLLLLDNSLPLVSGLELVRRARQLSHRKQTPIIVISASECADEARRAGADKFLKKPDDFNMLVETIIQILTREKREKPRSK